MNCVLDFYCFEFVEAFAGDFFVYVIFFTSYCVVICDLNTFLFTLNFILLLFLFFSILFVLILSLCVCVCCLFVFHLFIRMLY